MNKRAGNRKQPARSLAAFSPGHRVRVVALGIAMAASAFAAPLSAAERTESVEQYDARLARVEESLRRMEPGPARNLDSTLQALAQSTANVRVRRADGEVQPGGSEQFKRLERLATHPASRQQVQQAREAIAMHRRALAIWAGTAKKTTAPANAEENSDLVDSGPADAQAMVRQLESTGQIRTGPTAMEQWTADALKWAKESFIAFLKWIGDLFPSNPNPNVPTINWRVVGFIFWATVFLLLVVIVYLVWKAIGGRLGRQGARRLVRFEGSVDSELLVLPPDELRERARQLAAAGNFREALRHLYIALLLTLDARGVWHYDTRRTNWEHIAALRRDPTTKGLVAALSDLTRRFDRVRYGNAACDNADWMRFERDVVQLEQKTPGAPPAHDS